MVITLDGPSGTGKSTLAKELAQKLNFNFLNSGMIYRSLTYYFLTNNITDANLEEIQNQLENIKVDILFEKGQQKIIINGINCTEYVSSQMVQQNVALFSQIAIIREKVLNLQRNFAKDNNIVIEGRDVGSEVFPNANYKFYVECDINVRAQRRYEDLKKIKNASTLQEVKEALIKRDNIDKNRKLSPLRMPEGAIVINTSNKTINESVSEILSIIKLK